MGAVRQNAVWIASDFMEAPAPSLLASAPTPAMVTMDHGRIDAKNAVTLPRAYFRRPVSF